VSDYQSFLAKKIAAAPMIGVEPRDMPDFMKPHQVDATAFTLRTRRAGNFLDTGMGKTVCELEYSRQAAEASNGMALIGTPLAVAKQIEREAKKFGYDARVIRHQSEAREGINICNYDRFDNLEPKAFGAVTLDESSILKDFSGEIIRIHEDAGWILHSRRTIWKCPVVEMTRTKHVGLLYKQLQKDSSKSRGGMPDYLLTFMKPGINEEPIAHTPSDFPLDQWQEWASPVWMSVEQSNVLNVKLAREAKDERHLCPLQLDVIERAVIMWSNPGDTIFSPFMGIGSEGYSALKLRRRFVGVELKESYWRQACNNLEAVDAQEDMFVAGAVA
jgi:hypothetical protein